MTPVTASLGAVSFTHLSFFSAGLAAVAALGALVGRVTEARATEERRRRVIRELAKSPLPLELLVELEAARDPIATILAKLQAGVDEVEGRRLRQVIEAAY